MSFRRKGREEERVGKGKREKKGEERGRKKREEGRRERKQRDRLVTGERAAAEAKKKGKRRGPSEEDETTANDDDQSDRSGRRSIRCPVPAPSSALASPCARSEARIDRPLWLRREIG
jgi:hypothetical protein